MSPKGTHTQPTLASYEPLTDACSGPHWVQILLFLLKLSYVRQLCMGFFGTYTYNNNECNSYVAGNVYEIVLRCAHNCIVKFI